MRAGAVTPVVMVSWNNRSARSCDCVCEAEVMALLETRICFAGDELLYVRIHIKSALTSCFLHKQKKVYFSR